MVVKSLEQKTSMIRAYISGKLTPTPFRVNDDGFVIANLIIVRPGEVLSVEDGKVYPSAAISCFKRDLRKRYRGKELKIKWCSAYEYAYIVGQLKKQV